MQEWSVEKGRGKVRKETIAKGICILRIGTKEIMRQVDCAGK